MEGGSSVVKKVLIQVDSGPICLQGTVDFTKIFECMKNPMGGGLAEKLSYPDLGEYFLILGARNAVMTVGREAVSHPETSSSVKSPGKRKVNKFASQRTVAHSLMRR